MQPVGMASTSRSLPPSPKRMMAPEPNFLRISAVVASTTLSRSSPVVRSATVFVDSFFLAMVLLSSLFCPEC